MSWIQFVETGKSPSGLTTIWEVRPTDGSPAIGLIRWYSNWRKYTFLPASHTVFEEDCLREIATFCVNATLLHREAAKQRKIIDV